MVDMVDMVDMEKGRRRGNQTPRAKSRGKRYRLWRVLGAGLTCAWRVLGAAWRHFSHGEMMNLKSGSPLTPGFSSWSLQARDPSPILAEAPPRLELRSS